MNTTWPSSSAFRTSARDERPTSSRASPTRCAPSLAPACSTSSPTRPITARSSRLPAIARRSKQAVLRLYEQAMAAIDLRHAPRRASAARRRRRLSVHPHRGGDDGGLRRAGARGRAPRLRERFEPARLSLRGGGRRRRRGAISKTSAAANSKASPASCSSPNGRPTSVPAQPHPSAGATVIGARMPLIAYNINLATDRLDVAKKIAAAHPHEQRRLPLRQGDGHRARRTAASCRCR